jgi:hypothetical protein
MVGGSLLFNHTTRQYVKTSDAALGEAQLKRSCHFGAQKIKRVSDEGLNEEFFDRAFDQFIESEEFEALCSQPLSLSQCKKPRIDGDEGTMVEPLVEAIVLAPVSSSSNGKSTTFNFSFVIN